MKITPFLRSVGRLGYSAYAWIAFAPIVIVTMLLLLFTPGILNRRRLAKRASDLVFRVLFMPVRISGIAMDDSVSGILVANHASYLDGMVLTAALPPKFQFLIKTEMARVPVAGFILKRLDSAFVDRGSAADRHRVARHLFAAARKGRAFALFPEGTFSAEPGLKRFHIGAFTSAWRARLPILPVVIRGTRTALPSHRMRVAHSHIAIHICEPIRPEDFDSAQAMMAATRAAMLEHLGEPDLAAQGGVAVAGLATFERS